MTTHRSQVFISYSHDDKKWLERLQVHLKPLVQDGTIELWDDTRIKAGAKWQDEIEQAVSAAKVAILLVSADFLASDFIAENELPALLAAAKQDAAVILPVIVSPSRFEKTALTQFQAVNSPDKPLIELTRVEQEKILVQVSEAVEEALTNPWTPPRRRLAQRRGGLGRCRQRRQIPFERVVKQREGRELATVS